MNAIPARLGRIWSGILLALGCSAGAESAHAQPDRTAPIGVELRLTLEREAHRRDAPIRFRLSFHNLGDTPVTLDGLLPMRASANPPHLEVSGPDGLRFRTQCGTVPALQSEAPIRIAPNQALVLMEGDLSTCEGLAAHAGGELRPVPALGPLLVAGRYEIRGSFHPTSPERDRFQRYAVTTGTSMFRIHAD
jgi:hypothetical protein